MQAFFLGFIWISLHFPCTNSAGAWPVSTRELRWIRVKLRVKLCSVALQLANVLLRIKLKAKLFNQG
jgi:hypothetical protein